MRKGSQTAAFFTIFIICINCLIKQTLAETSTDQPVRHSMPESYYAVEYHNEICKYLPDLKMASFNYLKAVTRLRRARTVERKRQEYIKVLDDELDLCKKTAPFNNDSKLKSDLTGYLELLSSVVKQDFGKVVDMEEVEAQSYDEDDAHEIALDKAIEKQKRCFDMVSKTEEEFFAKYNIVKIDKTDSVTAKIKEASKAVDYYNSIYRAFRKVNKEYGYAIDAVNRNDLAGLEQHTAALVSFCDESFDKLKQFTPYKGDNELIEAAKAFLGFYSEEGRKTLPSRADLYVKADNLQKASKKLNSIRESERTKSQIDEFNESVNAYNKTVSDVNKASGSSQKKHAKLIEAWDESYEKFFKKNSL